MNTKVVRIREEEKTREALEKNPGLLEAAEILRNGGLVAFPTETVYGLGANALNEEAAKKIYAAKGRPSDNPLIAHISCMEELPAIVKEIPEAGRKLAEKYWPGPLTMIFPKKDVVPYGTTGGLDTVAVRMPSDPVANRLIKLAGIPVAAPSANTSGRPSPTRAEHVIEDMDGKIEMILDGGQVGIGVESTIVDVSGPVPTLLRPGAVTLEMLRETLGQVEVDPAVTRLMGAGEQPKAPGMKYRHYAPKAPVTVITGAPEKSAQEILRRVGPTSGVICFEEFADLFREQEVHTLGPVGDKLVQAQRVFDALRTFDTSDVTEIFAQCPDNRGLGLAIGNRLKKAAGFHVVEADSERVVLGLTGGTGAGKSSALRAIRSLGGEVIDCDALYHEMLETCAPLRDEIGVSFPGAFDAAGQLDRRKLGQEVFSHKDRLEQLNGIVARHLVPEVRRRLAASESKIFAIDAINLLEGGLDQLCDRTIAVTAPLELRVRRIMARDNITEQYARLRISAQQPDEYYRGKCDCELNNAADTAAAFEMEAREFFQRLIDTIKEEKAHGKQGI